MVAKISSTPFITLCCAYVPPHCSHHNIHGTLDVISHLSSIKNSHLVIVGDFNIPDVNWSTLTTSSIAGSLVRDCIFDSNLFQLVQDPTHFKGNVLALVVMNSPSLVHALSVDTLTCANISDYL